VSLEIVVSLLGLAGSLGFFGLMMVLLGRAVNAAQERYRSMSYELERIDGRCEVLEREREQISADNDSRRVRIEQIKEESESLRVETANIISRSNSVFYIFNDRWTIADEEWIIPVRNLAMFGRSLHRQVIESWSEGRSYVVWAPKIDIALRQVENRFPVTGGYLIGAPVASPLRLATKWTYKTPSKTPPPPDPVD
jgi:hypothetical protein